MQIVSIFIVKYNKLNILGKKVKLLNVDDFLIFYRIVYFIRS